MADSEDKPLPPVFHGDKDKTNARQIAGRVIDPLGFEKHYRTAPDGTVTRLDTKGGQPQVIVDAPGLEEEPPDEFSGLAYVPRNISEKLTPTVLLKLSDGARPLKRGKVKPRIVRKGISFGYSMLAGYLGGLSVNNRSKIKCLWMHGAYKIKRDMFVWKSILHNNVKTDAKDEEIIPFCVKTPDAWAYFWASRHRVVDRNGALKYDMPVPSRTVFLSGPKDYDIHPPQVAHNGSVVLQCSDSQTFANRPAPGEGTVTDLTRYYQTVVLAMPSATPTLTTGRLETFLPARTTTGTSNTDGESVAVSNPCIAYRPWWDNLNPDGTGKIPNYMRVESVSASDSTETPACADATSSSSLAASTLVAFTKTALDNAVVEVKYASDASYAHNLVLVQEYSSVGMGDPFADRMRQIPYQFSGARQVFKGSLEQTESASVSAGVVVGSDLYPFFIATGSSGSTASKHQDTRHEYFHPPYGSADDGTWAGIVDTQGLTIGQALENACGYSYAEMMGWSGIGGIGTNKVIKAVDSETATRESHCQFDATGRFYLAGDVSLRFSAWVECHFEYNLTASSSPSDKWKWVLGQMPPATQVTVTVDLVIKHHGVESRSSLFAGTMTMPPPVRSVAYPNPYYFIPLHYGIAPAGEISADGADVCWTYQVPDIEPQPGFFNSIDTLLQGQQTSPYVAGFSQYELALASAEKSALSKYENTVIASRRIKLREAGADWLFSYYGIDRPISLSPTEADPAKLRKYGFSDALYALMFDTIIRFEADTNTIRYWLEDVDSNAVSPAENKNAFCFRM